VQNQFRSLSDIETSSTPSGPYPDQRPVAGWKIHNDDPAVFLPCYDDPLTSPDWFYCAKCQRHFISIKDNPGNLAKHLHTLSHSPKPTHVLPSLPAQRDFFTKGAIISGNPTAELQNPYYAQAIPGLPEASALAQQYPKLLEDTGGLVKAQLRRCEFVTVQFDLLGSIPGQKFLGVVCQGLYKGTRFQCSLGTIPIALTGTSGEFIASELDTLFQKFEVNPVACVTDIYSRHNLAIFALNRDRVTRGKPALDVFPCACQIVNQVLRAFLMGAPDGFAMVRVFGERLCDGRDDFTQLCAPPVPARMRFAELCDIPAADPIETVMTIGELQREIGKFIDRGGPPEMIDAAVALNVILGEVFARALEILEIDKLGTMGSVKAILIGIGSNLDQITGYWIPAAERASGELAVLLQDHAQDLEPLISIAARLNPDYPQVALFDEDARRETTAHIIEGAAKLAARQPASADKISGVSVMPVSGSRCGKLLSYMRTRPEGDTSEENLQSRLNAHLSQYDTDAHFLAGNTEDWVGYWIKKRAVWPELAAYALSILTRPVSSVTTARHFPITPELSVLRSVHEIRGSEDLPALETLIVNQEIALAAIELKFKPNGN
jgi:hypothetical protein